MSNGTPSLDSVLATLIGVTWRRLFRGRAVWVVVIIAALPILFAVAMQGRTFVAEVTAVIQIAVLALLPPIFVASSIGEEIEDRTTTYLWSRPVPRWSIIVGKFLALAPVAVVLIAGSWLISIQIGTRSPPSLQSTFAFAAGAVAISAIAAGIALLVPRHGMALSIVYLVIVDLIIGGIPASLQSVSITRQVRLLAGLDTPSSIVEPLITMAVISGVWLGIGLLRLRRLES